MAQSEGVDASTPSLGKADESFALETRGLLRWRQRVCLWRSNLRCLWPRSATSDGTSYEVLDIQFRDLFSILLALVWYAAFKVTFAYFDDEPTSPGRFAPHAHFLRSVCSPLSELAPSICAFWLIAELGGGAKQGTSICWALVLVLLWIFQSCLWDQFGSGPGVGKTLFISVAATAAYALSLPIGCCMAKRRRRVLVIMALLCYVTIIIGITLAEKLFNKISKTNSGLVNGVCYPMLCFIAEHGSWFIIQIVWYRFGKEAEAPRSFFSILTAFVVVTAKSLHSTCFMYAIRHISTDWSHALQQISSSFLTMVLGDVAKRLQIASYAYVVCSRTLGYQSCFPPSRANDLLLRTQWKFGYSPIASSVLIIFYLCSCTPEQSRQYWLALGAVLLFLVTELMSSIVVLLIQSKMHKWPLCKLGNAWQQLQRPGKNLILGLDKAGIGEEPTTDSEITASDEHHQALDESGIGERPSIDFENSSADKHHPSLDDQGFFRMSARRMGCILVSLSVLVVTQHPIRQICVIGLHK